MPVNTFPYSLTPVRYLDLPDRKIVVLEALPDKRTPQFLTEVDFKDGGGVGEAYGDRLPLFEEFTRDQIINWFILNPYDVRVGYFHQ